MKATICNLKEGDYVCYESNGFMSNGHIFRIDPGKDTVIIDNGYGGARGLAYVNIKNIKKL